MSKSCVTCGASFNGTENDLARLFKDEYDKRGVERYVYRLSSSGTFFFVKKQYFNVIFESQIKPNLKNGAEYWSIREFQI